MRARWAIAAIVLAGCGVSLPEEKRIEDLRIVEVRATPPEIRLVLPGQSATTAEDLIAALTRAPNLQEVTLSGLAAHPDVDATFRYDWLRCVPFGELECDTPLERFAETSSVVTFSPVEILINDLVGAASPAEALLRFTSDPRDLLNGVYANVIFQASVDGSTIPVDTQQLEGLKRLVIFDPLLVRVAILEARRLAASGQTVPTIEGVQLPTLCTNISEAELAEIFAFLERRVPNRAPTFTKLEMARRSFGVETATRTLEVGEVVDMVPGEELLLQGRALEGDKEAFALIDDNCQLQELNETLAWSWFSNLGNLSTNITVEGRTDANRDGERVVYTAPLLPQLRADVTRARIWSVLRDGRGGSESRVIDIVIRR